MADRTPARWLGIGLGVLLLLSGLVWMGQGIGLIPGSTMSGQKMWFWIGLGTSIAGWVLLRRGVSGPRT